MECPPGLAASCLLPHIPRGNGLYFSWFIIGEAIASLLPQVNPPVPHPTISWTGPSALQKTAGPHCPVASSTSCSGNCPLPPRSPLTPITRLSLFQLLIERVSSNILPHQHPTVTFELSLHTACLCTCFYSLGKVFFHPV